MKRVAACCAAAILMSASSVKAQAASSKPMPSDPCVAGAAQYYWVNAAFLAAILRVEGMGETQVVTNTNGTIDVGRGGINSVHFAELARQGITPQALMDACVNTYVAAWLISKNIIRYGNNWAAYAAYHSRTPAHNRRYQLLLANELVRMGIYSGPITPVPPLQAAAASSQPRLND
jgi:soluble lytic murein transglycosylase-like protein